MREKIARLYGKLILVKNLFSNLTCFALPIIFCLQSFLNMQLYEKALDLFEDDQSTSVSFVSDLLSTVLLLKLQVHKTVVL